MKALEALLENFWIIKEEDRELYYQIRDESPSFRSFIEDKLGYKLIVTPYMIKLEKLPGRAEPWMGIQTFEQPLEYAFLCILLVFLEDRGMGDQFVLSEITEFIQGSFSGLEQVDWTLFRHRHAMVRVMRFASDMRIVRVDDGDDSRFMDYRETEVLYQSTGLSRYFVRNFTGNLMDYSTAEDIEKNEWLEADRDRGRVRRHRVYRRLFMSPAVYSDGPEDQDYLYIKNQRSLLQKDCEDVLGSRLHIHRNGAFLVLNPDRRFKDIFPDNKGISDVCTQMCGIIVDRLKRGELEKNPDDTIIVSGSVFRRMTEECKENFSEGWSKEYRQMPEDRLAEAVIRHMKGFGMLEAVRDGSEIRILPLAGKLRGIYPRNFGGKAITEKEDGEAAV